MLRTVWAAAANSTTGTQSPAWKEKFMEAQSQDGNPPEHSGRPPALARRMAKPSAARRDGGAASLAQPGAATG
ncbi:hypothetical protein GCM10010975_29560 [Comamonas phosphati]|nr:hypothetical protein GCM10010975_29560 [Comamonas phosphati]